MVVAAGIDTWAPGWRLAEDSDAALAADAEAIRPVARGRMLPDLVGGHRVTWYPTARLLKAQGHPEPGALAPPNKLPELLEALAREIEDRLGAKLPGPTRFAYSDVGFEGVGRLDSTVNLAPASGSHGLAVLAGAAAARPPGRIATTVHRERGGRAIETVTWRGSAGVVARAYDKGVEANSAARGELVRFEDQRLWPKGLRRDVGELTADYVCATFRRRFEPLTKASKGLRVVPLPDLAKQLAVLVRSGEITPLEAKRAFAHLGFEAQGIRMGSRSTRYRDQMLCERLGLVVDDGVFESIEVNLAEELAAAFDPQTWHG